MTMPGKSRRRKTRKRKDPRKKKR